MPHTLVNCVLGCTLVLPCATGGATPQPCTRLGALRTRMSNGSDMELPT